MRSRLTAKQAKLVTAGVAAGVSAMTVAMSSGGASIGARPTAPATNTCSHKSDAGKVVTVDPGGSLQGAADAAGVGGTVCVGAGLYRLRTAVVPLTGQSFVGEAGAVVSGAVVVSGFVQSGGVWVAGGLSGFNPARTGYCRQGVVSCQLPNDVYVDNQPLRQVLSLSGLSAGCGCAYLDESAGKLYLADDPSGHQVELGLARQAFAGGADNVTIQGLVVEKFANEAQVAAVGSRLTWSIVSDEVRLNHGIGVGEAAVIRDSFIHDNGEMGIGMSSITAPSGSPFLVEDNEISGNNYAGYDPNWEGGCCKFGDVNGLVVSGNYIHDNKGKGLWSDGNNFNIVFENNRIIDNQYNGINYELSYNAIIRNNYIEGNGFGTLATTPLEGSGIELSNSCCTEITGNTVINNRDGIGLVQSNRGSGPFGKYVTKNNSVRHNVIIMSRGGETGMIAWVPHAQPFYTWMKNRFSLNDYVLRCRARPFVWLRRGAGHASFLGVGAWRALGNDRGGRFEAAC